MSKNWWTRKEKWYRYTIKEYLAFKGLNLVIYKDMYEPEGNSLREISHVKNPTKWESVFLQCQLERLWQWLCNCRTKTTSTPGKQERCRGVLYLTLPIVGIRCTGHIIQICTDNHNLKNSINPNLKVTYWACLIHIPDKIVHRVGRCRDPTRCCSLFLGSSS